MLEKLKKFGMHILRLLIGITVAFIVLSFLILYISFPVIPYTFLVLAGLYTIGFFCYCLGYLFFPNKDEEFVHSVDFEKAELQADSEIALKHLDKALDATDKDTFVEFVKKAYKALGGTKYAK